LKVFPFFLCLNRGKSIALSSLFDQPDFTAKHRVMNLTLSIMMLAALGCIDERCSA